MQEKLSWLIAFTLSYLRKFGEGMLGLYLKILQWALHHLEPFQFTEYLYYASLVSLFAFTIPGWRQYEIILDEEIIRHTITTNDFLYYILGIVLMGLPVTIKLLNFDYAPYWFKGAFIFGASLLGLVYILSFIFPERISPVKDSSFTPWFYVFGLNLGISLIMGVRGFFVKPSTRLKSSWL